jgi:hypothetical protein
MEGSLAAVHPLTGPSDTEAALAEQYARRAVGLASANSDPFAQAMEQSILGKALLTRGQSEAAIEPLQAALDQLKKDFNTPEQHPTVGEGRRSLLIAHRCTIDRYRRVRLGGATQVTSRKSKSSSCGKKSARSSTANCRRQMTVALAYSTIR